MNKLLLACYSFNFGFTAIIAVLNYIIFKRYDLCIIFVILAAINLTLAIISFIKVDDRSIN